MLDCEVIFSNWHNGIYYSGERVLGFIQLNLEKPMRLTDLIFKSHGRSQCQWTETMSTGKGSVTILFSAKVDHYKSSMSLLMQHPRDETTNTVILDAGTHSFPFSITLPEDIPTSFESMIGKVRYTIKVKAAKPKKMDEKYKTAFTVVSRCDLNSIPNCNMLTKMEGRRAFNSFFVSKGVLSMSVSLPVSGFLPGQVIPISCTIVNFSSVPVKEVKFTFVRIVTYTAVSPWKKSREHRTSIVCYGGNGVNKKEETSYQMAFSVPAVPPSTIMEKLPVTVEYELKVKAIVPSMHKDIYIHIPLKIGNIPLRNVPSVYGFAESQYGGPSASGIQNIGDAPPGYFDLMPSAEGSSLADLHPIGAVFKKKDDITFTPQYPVFRFPDVNIQNKEKL